MIKRKKIKAVFLDRDGVVNKYPGDYDYVKSWQEFRFLPGVFRALRLLLENGFKIFIISNQAGVGKGLYSQGQLDEITKNMLDAFSTEGIEISGVYYCTHTPEDHCGCRKPKSGMIDTVLSSLAHEGSELDIKSSYVIGDSMRDIELGRSKGLHSILLFSGKENHKSIEKWDIKPDSTYPDLLTAVLSITKQ